MEAVAQTEITEKTVWRADQLNDYQWRLACGLIEPLLSSEYPERIVPSDILHARLNQFREGSQNGLESISVVGFVPGDQTLRAMEPTPGKAGCIDNSVVQEQINNAKAKRMENIYGIVHSHPEESSSSMINQFVILMEKVLRRKTAAFSAGDLYALLQFNGSLFFISLVTENENMFAFVARDTKMLLPKELEKGQELFDVEWDEKCGIQGRTELDENGVRLVHVGIQGLIKQRLTDDPMAVSKGVAGEYNLVLYHGMKNKDLIRVFP